MKVFNEILCFAKGTKVVCVSGLRYIESIKSGDNIISYNHNFKVIENTLVEKVASSFHSAINIISFSNGVEIRSTTDHPYWVEGKDWCSVNSESTKENYGLLVRELLVGDTCLFLENEDLQKVTITNIATEKGEFKMYDISGGENNCFFANGILVHDENIMELNLIDRNIQYSTESSL